MEEMYCDVLPHSAYSSDLPPSDFRLFGSLKEALRGKRFRVDDEVKLLCNDGRTSNQKNCLKRIKWKCPSDSDRV